jgi:hypothetical protein
VISGQPINRLALVLGQILLDLSKLRAILVGILFAGKFVHGLFRHETQRNLLRLANLLKQSCHLVLAVFGW